MMDSVVTYTIRPFSRSDQDGARGLINNALAEHFEEVDESANPDLDDISKTYLEEGSEFVVAVDSQGKVVGTGCLVYEEETTGRIVRMSSAPHLRRKGLGSSILRHLEDIARGTGLTRLVVSTEPHWTNAVGLYHAHGYRQYAADEVDIHLEKGIGPMSVIEKVNLEEKFSRFTDQWSPKVVGELNGQQVKLAKLQGEFVWHQHEHEDELFLVVKGSLTIRFRDHDLELGEGEFCIVPRGVEHCPVAAEEVEVLLFEPASTLNTGDAEDQRRVDRPESI